MSARLIQPRSACSEMRKSLASCGIPLPLVRANSTASARKVGGYGTCVFAIVDSFPGTVIPSIQVSTESTQAHHPLSLRSKTVVARSVEYGLGQFRA